MEISSHILIPFTPKNRLYCAHVHKPIKIAAILGCLICVLAMFIAPTIHMPETVLRAHHSVSTAGLLSGGAVAIASVSAPTVQQRTSGSWHTFHADPSAGSRTLKVSAVMRC